MRIRGLNILAAFLWLLPCGAGVLNRASAQDSTSIRVAELNSRFARIYACPEEERWNASDSFQWAAVQVLNRYVGRDFPFEKIANLNYFKAGNGSFRMLNWGVPDAEGGTVSYKALLQVRRASKNDYLLYDLNDMSVYQPYPERETLKPESWWGAFYYQCIEQETPSKTYYTFLGWNSGQSLYQQAVIEVMTIKNDGGVEFGAPLFVNKGRVAGSERTDKQQRDNELRRIVFRMSRKSGMILRYDYQTYTGRTDKGRKVERKDNMIIFDVLGPQQSAMADDPAYYVPLGGKYQAYVFLNNKWRLQNEVSARNPAPAKVKRALARQSRTDFSPLK